MPMMYCHKCGKLISSRAGYCCRCGEDINVHESERHERLLAKRRLIADAVLTAAILTFSAIIPLLVICSILK
jgi:uncharacterized paraquat-inducible protein A